MSPEGSKWSYTWFELGPDPGCLTICFSFSVRSNNILSQGSIIYLVWHRPGIFRKHDSTSLKEPRKVTQSFTNQFPTSRGQHSRLSILAWPPAQHVRKRVISLCAIIRVRNANTWIITSWLNPFKRCTSSTIGKNMWKFFLQERWEPIQTRVRGNHCELCHQQNKHMLC